MLDQGRLRVVLVTDAVGGVWDSNIALARALGGSDAADVLLLVAGPPPDDAQTHTAQRIPRLTLRLLDGQLEWMTGGRDWLARHRIAVATAAVEWDADVVHVNQLGLAAARHMLVERRRHTPVLLGVHSDVVTWWAWVKDGGNEPRTLPSHLRWQYELAWRALRQADAVVCPSAFLAHELTRHYRLDRSPHVIHNAAEFEADAVEPAQREPHVAVVVAGRAWDEAKNVKLVAEAMRLCRRPWRVEVAGGVVEPGQPRPSVSVPGGVRYVGYLNKRTLAALLRRASVCIAPASYDPFGLGPAEAALAGCAVVANDIPSYREVWGNAALFFERNSAQSLATLLDRLYDDEATIRHHARTARQWVKQRYTGERMASAYLNLYRSLCRAAGSAGINAPGHRTLIAS